MTSDTPYTSEDDVVDVLPEDLDPQAFAGAYKFPDNSRRRIPAAMYVVLGIGDRWVSCRSVASKRRCSRCRNWAVDVRCVRCLFGPKDVG